MTILIKPSLKDVPRIREIISQWYDEKEVELLKNTILEELAHESLTDSQTWLLQELGVTIGVAQLSYSLTENVRKIRFLHIDGAKQGKGFGKILLKEIELLAKELNCLKILAYSNQDKNCPAFQFYKKMGYTFIENRQDELGRQIAVHEKVLTLSEK